jgi:arylsulfatase A
MHHFFLNHLYPVFCMGCIWATGHFTVNISAKTQQPNIILILADDLGYADLGCYGNPLVQTPHLDRMASEGMRFTDFHSNGPMCSPTRASILTGRYQQRVGVDGVGDRLNTDAITIAQRLRDDAGYATGMFGKWHISGHNRKPEDYHGHMPMDFGFDEFRGFMSGFIDYINHHTDAGELDWWSNDKLIKEKGYASHLLVDHALNFIQENKDNPFFLYLSFPEPHFPFMTPDDPPYFRPGQTYPTAGNPVRSRLGPYDGKPELQSVFHRMINEMDKGIGRVICALEMLGIDDNTLVFFTSDNGGYIYYRQLNPETQSFDGATDLNHGLMSDNGPYRGQKAELYEGGHRVPAIAWWPKRILPGTVTDEVTMTFDLVPTFMEVAGIGIPQDDHQQALDGTSLFPLLFRQKPLSPRLLYWLFRGDGAIRSGDWKLIRYKEKPLELYHLGEDPGESVNIVNIHAGIATQLAEKLEIFQKSMK